MKRLCEFNGALDGLRGCCLSLLLQLLVASLLIDAVQNVACTLVGWRRLDSGDDVIVVQVLWTEEVDMWATLVALVVAVVAIEAVATVLACCLFLLLLSQSCGLLLCVQALTVVGHAVDIVDAEACGQNGDLDLLAQFGVGSQSPQEDSRPGHQQQYQA